MASHYAKQLYWYCDTYQSRKINSVGCAFPPKALKSLYLLFWGTKITLYQVFQNDCGIVGCFGKNSLPPFEDKVPHYTTPNITSKPLASVTYHFCHPLSVVNVQKFTRK
jgi:hypothetical protein